jgi:autotransporter-associated beta strand protein
MKLSQKNIFSPASRRALISGFALLAISSAAATGGGIIAYNFSENPGNQALDSTTPKGPLKNSIWNDSNVRDEGELAAGKEANLVDSNGVTTGVAISWTSANTWYNGSGVGTQDQRVVVGYLDDGGPGVRVELTGIPYAKYNVYGIVGSDQGGIYTTQDFNVNGKWAFPVTVPSLMNQGSLGAAGNTRTMTGQFNMEGAIASSDDTAISTTTGQVVKVPYHPALAPSGPFTAEAWLKPGIALQGTGLSCALSCVNIASPRRGWLLYQSATGWNFRTFNENGTDTAVNITGGGPPVVDQWYHVVLVWDGSVGKIYVDGQLAATSGTTTYVAPLTGGDFQLGSRSDNGFAWTGSLDEVAFYNGALPASTIAAHRANGVNPSPATPYKTLVQASSPVGYWTGASTPQASAGTAQAYGNLTAAGQDWVRIVPGSTQPGNYWRVGGVTGATLNIAGLPRNGNTRGSLGAIIIEEMTVPEVFDKVSGDYEEVILGDGMVSVFRPGTDLIEITKADAFSVGNAPGETHRIQVVPMPGLEAGSYPLFDYVGAIGGAGFAGLSLAPSANNRYAFSLQNDPVAGVVSLNYTPAAAIVWAPSGVGTWDSTTDHWVLQNGGARTRFLSFDNVKFTDAAATGEVVIAGEVAPLSVVVNNTSRNYVFSGDSIVGTGSLTKSGPGSLTIETTNSFTGPVLVDGGTLFVSSAGNLGASGTYSLTLADNAKLNATASFMLNRRLSVIGGGEIAVAKDETLSISSGFKGGGTLHKTGGGSLRLSGYGSSSFEGDIVVKDGRLIMAGGAFNANIGLSSITVQGGASLWQPPGAFHALGGAWAPSPAITLEEGAVFTVDQENYLNSISLAGATVNGSNELRTDLSFQANIHESPSVSTWSARVSGVNSTIRFDVEDGPLDVDFIMSGQMVGNQAFLKSGPGTMVSSGASSFTGGVVIADGTLKLTGIGSFASSPVIELGQETVLDVSGMDLLFNVPPVQTIAGSGTIIGDIDLGGTISPGPKGGVGELTVDGTLTIFNNAVFAWDVTSWAVPSIPGVTHDVLSIGEVELLADPFGPAALVINAPEMQDFFEVERVYTIAKLDAAIPGFDPAVFAIDATNFVAATGATGRWSLRQTGKSLELVYSAGTGLPGYETWASGKGLVGAAGAFDADPDQDGVANAIEFVTGSDPKLTTNSRLPAVSGAGDSLIVSYTRSVESKYLPQVIEVSTDPQAAWTPALNGVGGVTVVVEEIDATRDRVTVTIPKNGRPKLLARLKVSQPAS